MLLKSRVYTREIGMLLLFITVTVLLTYLTIITPSNSKSKSNAQVPTVTKEYVTIATTTDTKVNFDAGITELLHDIDVEPIYQTEESIEETDLITYEFERIGYINVNTELNVRKEPNTDSEILSKLNWMDKVEYSIVDDNWACIKLNNDEYGFIASKYIVDNEEVYSKSYSVTGDKAKTYMDYRTITDRGSNQYKLQMRAKTNEENGLRTLRNRYMVAVGSYFGCSIGQFIDVVLDDGEVLECVVGDAKQDIHTDSQNLHGLSGDTVEFIVNEKILKTNTDVVGNISNVSDVFDGKVVEVRVYDHIEK